MIVVRGVVVCDVVAAGRVEVDSIVVVRVDGVVCDSVVVVGIDEVDSIIVVRCVVVCQGVIAGIEEVDAGTKPVDVEVFNRNAASPIKINARTTSAAGNTVTCTIQNDVIGTDYYPVARTTQ